MNEWLHWIGQESRSYELQTRQLTHYDQTNASTTILGQQKAPPAIYGRLFPTKTPASQTRQEGACFHHVFKCRARRLLMCRISARLQVHCWRTAHAVLQFQRHEKEVSTNWPEILYQFEPKNPVLKGGDVRRYLCQRCYTEYVQYQQLHHENATPALKRQTQRVFARTGARGEYGLELLQWAVVHPLGAKTRLFLRVRYATLYQGRRQGAEIALPNRASDSRRILHPAQAA